MPEESGTLTAHEGAHLPLLPSGPGGVHKSPLRKTRPAARRGPTLQTPVLSCCIHVKPFQHLRLILTGCGRLRQDTDAHRRELPVCNANFLHFFLHNRLTVQRFFYRMLNIGAKYLRTTIREY